MPKKALVQLILLQEKNTENLTEEIKNLKHEV